MHKERFINTFRKDASNLRMDGVGGDVGGASVELFNLK